MTQPLTEQDEAISRSYVDAEGVEWEVVEVDGALVPAARGVACLVFRAQHAIRRVWNYPPGWASLSPSELCRLSWQR